MRIPKKFVDLIDKISKKLDVPKEEIMELLQDNYNKNAHIKKEDLRFIKSWRETKSYLSSVYGTLRSRAIMKYFYPFGDSGKIDAIETKYIPHSLKIGFKADDGTPLDYRETIFGRPNPNYGQPYVGHEWEREIYGFISDTPDFKEPRIAVIQGQRENVDKVADVKLWKFYKVRLIETKIKEPREVWRACKATNFIEIPPPRNIHEIVEQFNVIPVEAIPQIYEMNRDVASFNQPIYIFKGYIERIFEPKEESDNQMFLLSNDEATDSITCFIKRWMKLEIASSSDVYIFGTVSKWNERIVINVLGYITGEKVF